MNNLLKNLVLWIVLPGTGGLRASAAQPPWWDNFPRMIITTDLATAQAYSANAAINDVANDPGWGLWFTFNSDSGASGAATRQSFDTAGIRSLSYNEAFGALPELQIPADRTDCQHAWHLYILRLNLDRLCLDRAQFIQELKQLNIGTSVHFIPLHLHPYYRETYGYAPIDFPVAFQEYQRVVSLPLYSKMSDEDVTDVIQAVSELVSKFRIKRAKKYKQKSQAVGP